MKYSEIISKIGEMTQLLESTDYIDNKINEALVFGTKEELDILKEKYTDLVANRKIWRKTKGEMQDLIESGDYKPDENNKNS